ncbi:ankyrin repeat domain-containing protein [Klebsormidium nitens]|uniref:Ankyrin repeat domain-containing protein n=1 Tax=Klebsormidium nitens TaxID=105231 RepID=A0A0U9HHS8_KLENI|nr:ankyrin repeat domain-containing protein [Klebsormidium nitens]|eukprot:GAQ77609.1 ankyrin repeat domain-containing protein [Klebsormidium nitens]
MLYLRDSGDGLFAAGKRPREWSMAPAEPFRLVENGIWQKERAHRLSRWSTVPQAQAAGAAPSLQGSRQNLDLDEEDDFIDDILEEEDDGDEDEYLDDDDDSEDGDFDDEDLFDADDAAEESSSRAEEQPTASTSSRQPPMQQALGFEKRRTKRNYVPDQDDEDFMAESWTAEDQFLHKKYLVNFGRFTSEKWLPLHTAAACGQVSNIRYLVQQGVDIDGLDRDGFTPLHKAVMNVRDAAVRQLLRLGAKALLVDQDGASLLHYACQAGNVPICKMLIRAKVPINQKDDDGWTPLHVAAQSGQRTTIRTLLMNGADPKARNRDNLTAYDLLKAYGQGFGYAPAKKLLAKPPNRRDLLTGRVR